MASVRLSPALKSLIKAPRAQPGPVPVPSATATLNLFDGLARSATANGLGPATWLTLSGAALVTLNSPATLCALYSYATKDLEPGPNRAHAASQVAAILREAGLKSISFSGIPRAINSLGALRNHLEPEVAQRLSTKPTREQSPETVQQVLSSATTLWNSIYDPHSQKLLEKLSESHPDLPVHILSSHYGPLLADPLPRALRGHAKVGRVLTSVVAIACLRAQGGVGPQVTSHVFGLRKSLERQPSRTDQSKTTIRKGEEEEEEVQGQDWLASEQGCEWVLEQVDRIVEVVAGSQSTFATRAKL
ncbi:Pxp2p [Sporobolomyces koalae]|uniref:Pxp2p n=1 Tax=Sporobolomyces koalae TaxID=500713 RepID=UPI003176FC9E